MPLSRVASCVASRVSSAVACRAALAAVTVAAFAAATVVGAERTALAAPMDPAPERLYLQPPNIPNGVSCQDLAANPNAYLSKLPPNTVPNNFPCVPNNIAFANMMGELGMAIAPPAFHAARTTGLGGFALSLQASYTHINANAVDQTGTQYWHQGTEGPVDPNNHKFSIVNNSPDSILQVYTLNARKGLPYGFEINGALGYVANTSLWVGGADVHWSLLEGFRTGVLGYLPDVAIGSGVRTVGGTPKFYLTVVGIDGQLSKPFTLADSAVLTPYVGVQRVIIFANSTVVDLTPNVDALSACGYQGTNVPGNPSAPTGGVGGSYNGGPICSKTLSNGVVNSGAFNNLTTFNKATLNRWRGILGVDYRYEILYLAAQFATDLESPNAENADLIGSSGSGGWNSKQWTLSLEAGVSF